MIKIKEKDRINDILSIQYHDKSKEKVEELIYEFIDLLLINSKLIAQREDKNKVQVDHIEEAYHNLLSRPKEQNNKEIIQMVGCTLFGSFVPGFINAASNGLVTEIIIYFPIGIIGLALFLIGFLRKR